MSGTAVRAARALVILGGGFTAAVALGQAPDIVVTAKPPPDIMTRVVTVADLDLSTTAGQRELNRRVEAAVDSLCRIPSPVGYYEKVMSEPCRTEAWASARPQLERLSANRDRR